MFSLAKVSAAVLTLASFAQATITINQPVIKGNSTNTISWTSTDPNTDPEVFSIELDNQIFNRQFALANNVPTSQGSTTFEWPVVAPSSTYTISFVDIGNINNVIAVSPSFIVQENDVGTSAVGTVSSTPGSTPSSVTSASSVASTTSALSSVMSTLTQTSPVASSTPVSSRPGTTSAATLSSVGTSTPASASTSVASASASSSATKELLPSGAFAALIAGALALLF